MKNPTPDRPTPTLQTATQATGRPLLGEMFNVLWHGALDTIEDAVVVVDADSRVLFANRAYARLFALSVPPIGARVEDEDVGEYVHAALEAGRTVIHEPVHIRALGRTVLLDITLLTRGDGASSVCAVIRETRQVKQVAGALSDAPEAVDLVSLARGSRDDLPPAFANLVGRSDAFVAALTLAARVAATDNTMLLLGESGTGKEVLAAAIAESSTRHSGPFVSINCAAIPEELLESELFGYESGSFTDARGRGSPGQFMLANHGTLFLDEIGEMPLRMQAKVLRAIENGEVERIGSDGNVRVDVRLIAATNRSLRDMVRAGTFRSDLYYRLNVFPIVMMPLRERRSDIPLLVEHFLEPHRSRSGRPLQLSTEAQQVLSEFAWPGNVRELRNVIEYAATLAEGNSITTQDLPRYIMQSSALEGVERWLDSGPDSLHTLLHSVERRALEVALQHCGYNCTRAMEVLGFSRRTFYRRLKEFRLDRQLGRLRRERSARPASEEYT